MLRYYKRLKNMEDHFTIRRHNILTLLSMTTNMVLTCCGLVRPPVVCCFVPFNQIRKQWKGLYKEKSKERRT